MAPSKLSNKFCDDDLDSALRVLADRLTSVAVAPPLPIGQCVGRVLATELVADRDSPAADVSAMDGYAIRRVDWQPNATIPVRGESVPGAPPPPLAVGTTVRIFTGAIIPSGCEAVVKREDTDESNDSIRIPSDASAVQAGQNIRRAGENATAGSAVLQAGMKITAAPLATMANFGCAIATVHRAVRVAIITTGDEVGAVEQTAPQPWQLRNSNRWSLQGMLTATAWIDVQRSEHARDDRQSLTDLMSACLQQSDAVLLTGGVSLGDYDYVPDVVADLGGEIVFHGLPMRPGKPILGAATGDGKLILGLPGNPVSATIGCRRMALPLLARQSGQTNWLLPCPVVRLIDAGDQTIPLHHLRLVRLTEHGAAQLVVSRGSGDLVSLGHSTGFVQLPPHAAGEGPWPYYSWE
jgi:molybdenum cofactor synthesis domain-containing protein